MTEVQAAAGAGPGDSPDNGTKPTDAAPAPPAADATVSDATGSGATVAESSKAEPTGEPMAAADLPAASELSPAPVSATPLPAPHPLIALFQRPLVRRGVFIVLLCALAIPVYAPALDRYFAGDQVVYFAELKGDRSLAAGLRHWDYGVTRRINRGDEALFRPLLCIWLGVQNTWFGYNHVGWNIANLILHLAAVYMLFELLLRLCPWPFAELGALLASIATAAIELVVWNHLGGYLLGYALLLLALLAARRVAQEGRPAYRRWLPVYALAITLSMGFYELAVGVSLLVPVYFWWCLRRRPDAARRPWLAASLFPPLLYAAVYAWRVWVNHPNLFYVDPHPEMGSSASLPIRCVHMIWDWSLQAADPWRCALESGNVGQRFFTWPPQRFPWVALAFYGGLAVLLALTLCSAASRQRLRREAPFLVLVTLMILGYAGMNCLGRTYTSVVPYYLYLFCFLGLILLFTAVDLARLHRDIRLVVAAGLVVLIFFNAWSTYHFNRKLQAEYAPMVAYFQQLDQAVKVLHDHPGATLPLPYHPRWAVDPDSFILTWGYPAPETPRDRLPMSAVMYMEYFRRGAIKYTFGPPSSPAATQPAP